jgi:SNF2 family DNA or RNA helicase
MIGLLDVIGIGKDFDINSIINEDNISNIECMPINEISNEIPDEESQKEIDYFEWSKSEIALSFALQTNKLYIEDKLPDIDSTESNDIDSTESNDIDSTESNDIEISTDRFEDMILNVDNDKLPQEVTKIDDIKNVIEVNNIGSKDKLPQEVIIKQYAEHLKNKFMNVHNKPLKKSVEKYRILPGGKICDKDVTGVISNNDKNEMKTVVNGERKIVYYAKHDETLHNLEKTFDEYGIPYLRISGTTSMIHQQVLAFNNNLVNILIINGEKYSSGLNLQKADTLIMCHPITNHAHRSQIIGRLMRIGATTKKNIVTIKYDIQDVE